MKLNYWERPSAADTIHTELGAAAALLSFLQAGDTLMDTKEAHSSSRLLSWLIAGRVAGIVSSSTTALEVFWVFSCRL